MTRTAEDTPRTRPSPLVQFQQLTREGAIVPDQHQLPVVRALDALWHELSPGRKPALWRRVARNRPELTNGLYLWGGVGRGKTWLMDLLYESLPLAAKRRVHFHRFMQGIHEGLRRHARVQNPLLRVAAEWSERCCILCLDEFVVTDIADAMLLAGLLEHLFSRGVCLVTTSNLPPDDLYHDGLQRAKFLPAIELLKRHTQVVHLEGKTDFRLRILQQSEIYHWPIDDQARENLRRSFERMTGGHQLSPQLKFNDRPFQAVKRGDGVIWFTFGELAEKPRGAIDFIEIARSFNTVLLSDIPQLGEDDTNAARRLITLVDEFYDRGVKLLMSAAVPLDSLYTGRRLAFEFERTISRLTEMQTDAYLARPHLS